MQLTSHDGDKAIGDDGRVDLYIDSVFAGSVEFLDMQVLLQPFEEKLYAPPVLIQLSYVFSREISVVGIEDESPIANTVVIDDPSNGFRIFVLCLRPREPYNLVCHNACSRIVVVFILNDVEFHLMLFPHHEECLQQGYCIKLSCVHIGTVEDVYGIRFVGYVTHHLRVMDAGIRDDYKRRNIRLHVIQGMSLHTAFAVMQLRPPIDGQAERNGGGIKCKHLVLDKELLQTVTLPASYVNEPFSILLEYPGLTYFVRLGEIAACDALAKAEAVKFAFKVTIRSRMLLRFDN